MQPIAISGQRTAEPGTMERCTAIRGVDHCAHWEGPAIACDGRDPPARPGRGQMRTEHAERYRNHQELCRIEHHPVKRRQLQPTRGEGEVGTGGGTSKRLSGPPSASTARQLRHQDPIYSIKRPSGDSQAQGLWA